MKKQTTFKYLFMDEMTPEQFKLFSQPLQSSRGTVPLIQPHNVFVWAALATSDGNIQDGHGDDLVGCVCLHKIDSGRARFKTDIVHVDYRRRGIYKNLFVMRLGYAMENGFSSASAICNENSLHTYLEFGFEKLRFIHASSSWRVQKVL